MMDKFIPVTQSISCTHKVVLFTLAGWDTETYIFIIIQRLLLKAFSPVKPLTPPPTAVLINSAPAEFSILLWLIEHRKPSHRFSPCISPSPSAPSTPRLRRVGEGLSFLQCPICRTSSPLRNSALVIEKGKICTTCSSLKETSGVIQDVKSSHASLFKLWNLCSGHWYPLTPRNSEVSPHTFVVLHSASSYSSWKAVLISHHPNDTRVSHERLKSKELHLVAPSQPWGGNPTYCKNRNKCRYLVSAVQMLHNLVALSPE